MKATRIIGWSGVIVFIALLSLVDIEFSLHARLILILKGITAIRTDWSYGATSSVPNVEVALQYHDHDFKCPYDFGGIEFAELRFADMDGDGVPDIVFGNGKQSIVVAIKPNPATEKVEFVLLKDDVNHD